MKKQAIFLGLFLGVLILVGVFVSSVYTSDDFKNIQLDKQRGSVQDEEHVVLNIKSGWNLLPISFIAEAGGRYWGNYKEGSTCDQNIFQNVWYYSSGINDYYHFPVDEEGQLANIDDWRFPKTRGNDFLLSEFQNKFYNVYAGSAWIYSESDCILEGDNGVELLSKQFLDEEQDKSYTYDELVLKSGWNLIPIDKWMVFTETSLSQIFEGCNIEEYVFWDNENQEWVSSENELNFIVYPDDIFKTFAVKTKTDCNLAKNIYNLIGQN